MNSNSLFDISNKTVLITGGAQGIGKTLVEGFKNAGATVISIDKSSLESNIDNHFKVDLTADSIENLLSRINTKYKDISVVINCAGTTHSKHSLDYETSEWDQTLSINLSIPFKICQFFGNRMKENNIEGSIINVTSIGDSLGFPNNPAYCASKGGLKQLTKALAYDFSPYNIRVNNLAPGYTNTPMNQKSWSDSKKRQLRSDSTMLNRWANPEDMLGPAIFLASKASNYVTGTTLYVDGGWTAKGL